MYLRWSCECMIYIFSYDCVLRLEMEKKTKKEEDKRTSGCQNKFCKRVTEIRKSFIF